MKHFRIIAVVVSAIAIVLGTSGPAPADIGLDVTPAKFELSMAPGNTYNVPITIRNGGTDATHIQVTLVDFNVAENGEYVIEHVGARPNSLMKYASVNPREFDLPGNSTEQIRLTLTLPNDKKLSGEYAGIAFFQTRPTRRAGAVAFSARIASKFYLTIPGTVKIDGGIAKMTAGRAPGGEIYRVLYKNLGNTHQYLSGEVEVQKDGQTIQTIPMPRELLVERGGERLIEVNGSALSPGKYQVIAIVDYGGKTQTGGEIIYNAK